MLKLSGLTPTGVRHLGGARLIWNVDGVATETDFHRFLPVRVNLATGKRELEFTWRDFADVELTDTFFEDSAKRAWKSPFAAKEFRTTGDTLSLVAKAPTVLPFSGAVFHMARTGSTLIHRVFSRTGKTLSLSEPPSIDRLATVTRQWSTEDRNKAFRDLVAVLRRARRANEKYCIAKMTDGGASITLGAFRTAFPSTPWIFVYRDPIEVMASVLAQPTGHLEIWFKNRTDSAKRLGIPALNDPSMWPAEFIARTLRRFCMDAVRAARATPSGKFLAVDYSRLPNAIWETIAPHFDIELTDEDRALMIEEARYSAKKKEMVEFVPDADAKRAKATPWARELTAKFVAPAIEQLKTLPQG